MSRILQWLACGLLLVSLALIAPAQALARSGTEAPPARPSDPETLKAYDVVERHCARCHQAGSLQRAKPAADFANILRLDEVAAEPHYVRPGNPDASRLYALMLGRHMPYDVYHEGAERAAPSPDDIDVMRSWIAGLSPAPRRSCGTRPLITPDAQQIAIARDLAQLPPELAARTRYLSLAALWNDCASADTLAKAEGAAGILLSGLARGIDPVRAVAPSGTGDGIGDSASPSSPSSRPSAILRVDLGALQWTPAQWDDLAQLSPYAVAPAGASSAASQPVRLDWLAYLLSDETRKRATSAFLKPPALIQLTEGATGLARLRATDPPAFAQALTRAGLYPAPVFDLVDMSDVLARRYARDVDLARAAAELGAVPSALPDSLDAGPEDARQLMSRLAQGGLSRALFEPAFALAAARLAGRETAEVRVALGAAQLPRPPARPSAPAELEIVAAKAWFAKDEAATLVVRSQVDCHLTLVSVSPTGRAVVLLPNDWDRNTFLPAGKSQAFPRDDSPFRLKLDSTGWETIVAGCNPAAPVFDGIQHDFNLEKFTSLGDYRRFLLRMSEGMPMLVSSVPPGEKRAAAKPLPPARRAVRTDGGKAVAPNSRSDATARTAVRFEVR